MIKSILKDEPYELVVAWNGKEGVEKAKTEKPDAIILDIMMPEKDGFWACKQIKADPELENIPVLVLTAVGQHFSDTSYAKGEGMLLESDDYIEKPIDGEYLKQRLSKYLKK